MNIATAGSFLLKTSFLKPRREDASTVAMLLTGAILPLASKQWQQVQEMTRIVSFGTNWIGQPCECWLGTGAPGALGRFNFYTWSWRHWLFDHHSTGQNNQNFPAETANHNGLFLHSRRSVQLAQTLAENSSKRLSWYICDAGKRSHQNWRWLIATYAKPSIF